MQIASEPKSFASADSDMDVDPIPTRNVTLPKLAKGLNQIHTCFEDQKQRTEKFGETLETLQSDVAEIKAAPGKLLKWLAVLIAGTLISSGLNIVLHLQSTNQQTQAATDAKTAAAETIDTNAKVTKVAKALGTEP